MAAQHGVWEVFRPREVNKMSDPAVDPTQAVASESAPVVVEAPVVEEAQAQPDAAVTAAPTPPPAPEPPADPVPEATASSSPPPVEAAPAEPAAPATASSGAAPTVNQTAPAEPQAQSEPASAPAAGSGDGGNSGGGQPAAAPPEASQLSSGGDTVHAATGPVVSTTHSTAALEAAGNPISPVEHAVGGATTPALDPVVSTTQPLTDAAGGLAQPVTNVADPIVGATTPALDPVVSTTQPLTDAAGGLAQPVAGIADPITSNLVPHVQTTDSYIRGADAWFDSAFVPGLSPHEGAVAATSDPGGIGAVAGSILDSVANGSIALPTGTAPYASVVALVAALGFTASRFGSAASGVAEASGAGSSGGVIRLGVRLAWLASWDSARCVLASAAGLAGTSSPALLASATGGGFAANQGGASATRTGETVRSLLGELTAPGKPKGSSLPGLVSPGWSFGHLLRGLLLLAGGLLGLAVFPVRHRGRMAPSPVRLSLAVMALSILLAMGIVLLSAA
jgi:hypothetical protein